MKQGKFNNTDYFNGDDINIYLKDIRKYDILTGKELDDVILELKCEQNTEQDMERLHTRLILGNLRFVLSVAKQYQNQGLGIGDLVNEGNIGLMRAAKDFNPEVGTKFISYAVWWVRQSITNALNEYSRTIRYPSNIILKQQKQRREELDMDEIDYYNIPTTGKYVNLPKCIALSTPINDDGDELIDVIINDEALDPESELNDNGERRKHIEAVLNILTYRERTIVEKYFGLYGEESNLDELGVEFNCTRERIRQLKEKAMKKLKNESFPLLKYL